MRGWRVVMRETSHRGLVLWQREAVIESDAGSRRIVNLMAIALGYVERITIDVEIPAVLEGTP